MTLRVLGDVDSHTDGSGLVSLSADLPHFAEVSHVKLPHYFLVACQRCVNGREKIGGCFSAFALGTDCGQLFRPELPARKISREPLGAAGKMPGMESGGCHAERLRPNLQRRKVADCGRRILANLFSGSDQMADHRINTRGNSAHPGFARTELIANGPGPDALLSKISGVLRPFMSQSAAAGALPTLFAATSPEAEGGAYYGPDGFYEMKGAPAPAYIAPAAKDEQVARRLWEVSEHLTGVNWSAKEIVKA